MAYRCVKSNSSDDVIAIGMDEGQGGQSYHDEGVWCDFTFDQIPEIPSEVMALFPDRDFHGKNLLKVVENTVVVKSLEELK
jgi:hypothetical protein